MNSGIYTITNTITNHMYIGSTSNFIKRWNYHKLDLRKNKHENSYLQRAWNKYGEENFIFDKLIECDVEFIYSEEHYWCNLLQTHNKSLGYNLKATHPNNKCIVTNETRQKLREKALTRRWSDEHKELFRSKKIGKSQSEEHIKKAKEGKYKTVYQYSLEGDLIKEWQSAQNIQKELNIAASNISRCCNNKQSHHTVKGFMWTYNK